jgi:Ni/Co efflux regulator RcnB
MIKSKSMAVAAAALAMCMAGGAFAQDRRFDHDDRRGLQQHQQQHQQHQQQQRQFDRHGARQDFRDGRQFDRHGARQDFRDGRHFDRHGYAHPRAEWRRGGYVPREYRGRNYVVGDWRGHRLQQPPRGYQWVGVGGDYVLAAIATGLIAQIIAGQ